MEGLITYWYEAHRNFVRTPPRGTEPDLTKDVRGLGQVNLCIRQRLFR